MFRHMLHKVVQSVPESRNDGDGGTSMRLQHGGRPAMHRPKKTEPQPAPLVVWLRENGKCTLLLAAFYFIFGQTSFLMAVNCRC
jgi:hypothetical protein